MLSETYTMATLPWVAGKFGVAEAAVIEVVEQSKAFDTIIPRQLWTQKLSQISGFTFIVVRPEVLFVSGYYDGRGEGVGVCAPNLLGIYAHEFVTFLLSDDFFFLISERDLGKLGPGDILYDVESSIAPLYVAGTTIKDRKSTRLNSSHIQKSRMPSSA